MVIRNYHWLNSASRVLISTCSALVQMGERKQTHTVRPWPLTYDLELISQASQGQGRHSCQKPRSKVKRFKQKSAWQTNGRTHTHAHTHADATERIISPATRSIIITYTVHAQLILTRSIWKMLCPFATASRRTPPVLILHCHSPGVATVARRPRIDVHNNNNNNNNDNAWQRGPLWPHRIGPKNGPNKDKYICIHWTCVFFPAGEVVSATAEWRERGYSRAADRRPTSAVRCRRTVCSAFRPTCCGAAVDNSPYRRCGRSRSFPTATPNCFRAHDEVDCGWLPTCRIYIRLSPAPPVEPCRRSHPTYSYLSYITEIYCVRE